VIIGNSNRSRKSPFKRSPAKKSSDDDNTLLIGLEPESPKRARQNDIPQSVKPFMDIPSMSSIDHNQDTHSRKGSEIFYKPSHVMRTEMDQHTSKKHTQTQFHKPPINQSLNQPFKTTLNIRLDTCENGLSQSTVRQRSRTRSINDSHHMTEIELLHVLNEKSDNKRRKKLDLPDKYAKIYEELHKDKLDVVDFAGAFLGDGTVLAISELFAQSRGKLKQVKLMNNKITDEIFPELINRCKGLQSLNLSYNSLSEKCLDWLEYEVDHLGDLCCITLSNNKISLRNNR
jgi:hypothetical protein